MAAYANPTRQLGRTRAFGYVVSGFVRGWVYDPEFHAPSLAALDTRGSAKGSGLPVQAFLFARARLHAILNVADVKSVGRYFPNLWRSTLDLAQDTGSILVFPSALEIYGASAAVEASRLFGVAYGARWDSSSRRNYESLEETSEHVKPEIERQLSKSHVRWWPSWEAIRQRWWRQNWLASSRPKGMARSKSASSLTFVAQAHTRPTKSHPATGQGLCHLGR